MTSQIIKLLLIIIPHMNKWSDEQLTTFCMVLDPYIQAIGWKESDINEEELITFLEDTIRIEESEPERDNQ